MNSLETLRQRANANLAKLKSGEVRRERLRVRAKKQADRTWDEDQKAYLEEEKKNLGERLQRVRNELADIEDNFGELYEKLDAGTLTDEERGMLEEIDPRRDELLERGVVLDGKLSQVNWELSET